MECILCNRKWESAVKSEKCPFCGISFISRGGEGSVSGILSKIVKARGIEILKDSRKLNGLMSDLFLLLPDTYENKREGNMFRRAVAEGVAITFYDIVNSNENMPYEPTINKAIHKLVSEAFVSEEHAIEMVNLFACALSLPRKEIKKKVEAVKVSVADSSGIKADGYKQSFEESIPEETNSVGNIVNGGYVASNNELLFFQNESDGNKLYKMSKDGKERQKINDDKNRSFRIVGDWIFYCNSSDDNKIYRMHLDGSDRQKLNDDEGFFINALGS